MDLRLLTSLLYLIDVASRGLKRSFPSARDALERLHQALFKGARLSFSAYVLHTQLHRTMKRGEAANTERLISHLSKAHLVLERFNVRSFPSETSRRHVDQYLRRTLNEEHLETYLFPFDGSSPPRPAKLFSARSVHSTLRLLKEVDPLSCDELLVLVGDIFIMCSSKLNAGTSFPAFGCVYLTALRSDQNWTAYLEHLVHEAAHHYLFALWSQAPILAFEPSDTYLSPLRTEPRPVSAIFHQMFVLARVIRTKRLFEATGRFDSDLASMRTQYQNDRSPGSFEEKFQMAAEVIEAHAKLTALGESVFRSARELVAG
jgi:HEXXH motif-containing protein